MRYCSRTWKRSASGCSRAACGPWGEGRGVRSGGGARGALDAVLDGAGRAVWEPVSRPFDVSPRERSGGPGRIVRAPTSVRRQGHFPGVLAASTEHKKHYRTLWKDLGNRLLGLDSGVGRLDLAPGGMGRRRCRNQCRNQCVAWRAPTARMRSERTGSEDNAAREHGTAASVAAAPPIRCRAARNGGRIARRQETNTPPARGADGVAEVGTATIATVAIERASSAVRPQSRGTPPSDLGRSRQLPGRPAH